MPPRTSDFREVDLRHRVRERRGSRSNWTGPEQRFVALVKIRKGRQRGRRRTVLHVQLDQTQTRGTETAHLVSHVQETNCAVVETLCSEAGGIEVFDAMDRRQFHSVDSTDLLAVVPCAFASMNAIESRAQSGNAQWSSGFGGRYR